MKNAGEAVGNGLAEWGEKIQYHNNAVQEVEQQIRMEQVERANETAKTLWDNYMFSLELENQNIQMQAQGVHQWWDIAVNEDTGKLTAEDTKIVHNVLDVMSILPGAGAVYDLMNGELCMKQKEIKLQKYFMA